MKDVKPAESNDDDDFFDDRADLNQARDTDPSPASQQEEEKVVTLPPLGVDKLSKEMSDFKSRMTISLAEQKKKNQLGDQVIAERADESDEDEMN